ncbi:MAG: hypothetical protein QOE14_2216, partial [Humisphaera sp.]|nr:hypothetical protein [Humisphaera sp.]
RRKNNAAAQQGLLRMGADPLRGPNDALPMPPTLAPYQFIPPPKAPVDEPPPGQDDFFGLPTPDVIAVGVLIDADVATTASALVELLGADIHHHNALGRDVPVTQQSFIVWRLAGHAWSAVTQAHFLSGDRVLEPLHAAALSKRLGARAIYVNISDTAGSGWYALFDDQGVVQEVFEMTDDAEPLKDSAAIANAVAERMQIDMSPLAERMSFAGGMSFGSTLRDQTVDDIDNPWKFFDQFLTDQRALSPSAWSDRFEAGNEPNTVKLVMPQDDFGYDAVFERVDYVAVTGS